MKEIFKVGDVKMHNYLVTIEDVAKFDSGVVHSVCSTFALAREIEWSSRLFVLDMKEDDEEGIGTAVTINHHSPALVGNELIIMAQIKSIRGNELICQIEIKSGERLVATGSTGQKILSKVKIEKLFSSLD